MDSLKPFLFGSLATLVVAGALFGSNAYAETQQPVKNSAAHLVSIETDSSSNSVSADLVDQIDAYDNAEGVMEVHITSINDFSGEEKEILQINMTRKALNDFIKEVNKYRN